MSPLPGDAPYEPMAFPEEIEHLRIQEAMNDHISDVLRANMAAVHADREGECRAFLRFLSVATGVDEVSITATEAARPGRGQISFTVPPAPASSFVAPGGYCAPLIELDRHIPFPHIAVRKGGIKYDVSSYDLSMKLCDPAKDNIWHKRLPRAARIWWGGRRPVSAYRKTKRRITDVRNVWAGRTVSADPDDLY